MTRKTFYSLLFILTMIITALHYAPNSVVNSEIKPYYLELNNNEINVINPDTRETIYSEEFSSGSLLSKAILKDNH